MPDHDLDLPAWGPYGKLYAGCSHLADQARGLRWDVSVFPGFYRGRIDIPAVNWDSGWAPGMAVPDGSGWSFVHALDGRSLEVTTTWAGVPGDDSARVARIRCVNRTEAPQALAFQVVCALRPPSPGPCGHADPPVLEPLALALPAGGAWCDARDHAEHRPGRPSPLDRLQPDGRLWGEFRASGLVDGGGLRLGAPGDRVRWRLPPPGLAGPVDLVLRLRAAEAAVVRLDGEAIPLAAGPWSWLVRPWRGVDPVLELAEGGPLEVDVVAAVPAGTLPALSPVDWGLRPERLPAGADGAILRHPSLGHAYGLRVEGGGRWRTWDWGRLDQAMRFATHDHVSAAFAGDGRGHWTNLVVEPVVVPPGAVVDRHLVVAAGDSVAVAARLAEGWERAAAVVASAEARAWRPAGPDAPGQRLMAATLLTNPVFPIYTRRRYVRHIGPGKAWDSLYWWDSGFNGIGLSEVAPGLAGDILAQYLMPEGDRHAAWLHHGSPVPVMVHLAQVLWNRGADRGRLAACYPGLRQMHRFLAGRDDGGARVFASGLLATWDLFYNSGGWDDYPAQVRMHAQGLAGRTAPAVTASMVAASARLLRRLARLLGRDDDAEYDADIARLGAALRTHAWDDEAGWFGYVLHDGDGRPAGLLRGDDGANLNMGLDGCTPLLAGVCDAGQEARLLAHLADPAHLWTPVGLTTVSRSSAAYRPDGYWNGAVWMPWQWFFWRACLDLGRGDLAWRIASTALAVWEGEVARSGRSWEHFPVEGGRGAGWHHFGALSAPVLAWHGALHTPGRITGGAGLWILGQSRAEGAGVSAELLLDGREGGVSTVLVRLDPGPARFTWDGTPLAARERIPGLWELGLPAAAQGRLEGVRG